MIGFNDKTYSGKVYVIRTFRHHTACDGERIHTRPAVQVYTTHSVAKRKVKELNAARHYVDDPYYMVSCERW